MMLYIGLNLLKLIIKESDIKNVDFIIIKSLLMANHEHPKHNASKITFQIPILN